jgi:TonB family protein
MRLSPFAAVPLLLAATPLLAQDRGPGSAPAYAATAAAARPAAACWSEPVESVLVSGPEGVRNPVLDGVAAEVDFWFRPRPSPSVRNTSFTVTVGRRTGVAIAAGPASADSAFGRAARNAVDAAVHEHAFDRLAPDSASGAGAAVVVVHFGEDAAGRQVPFVQRRVCSAVARPESPKPAFPLELTPEWRRNGEVGTTGTFKTYTRGEVTVRFLVDSTGTIDQQSVQVLGSTHDAFVRELRRVLPLMRYFPAELAGRPAPQLVEQRFDFDLR